MCSSRIEQTSSTRCPVIKASFKALLVEKSHLFECNQSQNSRISLSDRTLFLDSSVNRLMPVTGFSSTSPRSKAKAKYLDSNDKSRFLATIAPALSKCSWAALPSVTQNVPLNIRFYKVLPTLELKFYEVVCPHNVRFCEAIPSLNVNICQHPLPLNHNI